MSASILLVCILSFILRLIAAALTPEPVLAPAPIPVKKGDRR